METGRRIEWYVEAYRSERTRVEQLMCVGGPADLKKTKGQGRKHLCDTGMPVRNRNLGTDRTTTTKAAGMRKQLGTKNSKSNEGRQYENGGGETGAAEELDRETGEKQITVGRTSKRMADGRLPKNAAELGEHGRRRRERQRLRWEDCVERDVASGEGMGGGRLEEEEDRRQRRVKRLSDEAVKTLRAAPHHRQREKRKREIVRAVVV